MYSRRQYKVSVPSKKTVVLRHTNVFKTVTVFTAFIRSQFLRVIFRLTPPKSINEIRAVVSDRPEQNWQAEKRLIDKKSRNNRRTEAETIEGLKRNWQEEELLIDEKSRNKSTD